MYGASYRHQTPTGRIDRKHPLSDEAAGGFRALQEPCPARRNLPRIHRQPDRGGPAVREGGTGAGR
ncbi:hypothetical protein D3C73_1342520 [compost metagenome]